MFEEVYLELMLLTALILAIVSGLIIYIAVLKLREINQVTINDAFDRRLIKSIIALPVESKDKLEDIVEGLHDDRRES